MMGGGMGMPGGGGGMIMSGPPGMMHPSNTGMPMDGYSMHMSNPMGPPPLPPHNMGPGQGPGGPINHSMSGMMRGIPSELEAVMMDGMGFRGIGPEEPRRNSFGILRLLHFNAQMRNLKEVKKNSTILFLILY